MASCCVCFLVSDELGTFIAAHTVGRDYTRNELINARRPWKLLLYIRLV